MAICTPPPLSVALTKVLLLWPSGLIHSNFPCTFGPYEITPMDCCSDAKEALLESGCNRAVAARCNTPYQAAKPFQIFLGQVDQLL